jgi:aminoglycoside 3-N-acetyltransferase
MTLNGTELTKQWKSTGLKQGDNILIHSSLKSFGYVQGGASAVIRSLLDTIGEEGTLLVPTLTGQREDSISCPPAFDVLQTKSWTGIIPETVRNMEIAKRSLHPTHSAAAIGSRRDYLTDGHEESKSPCDESSPYYKNSRIGGHIILAGVDQESNTSIHSCEEIAGVIYHLQEEPFAIPITGYRGEAVTVTNRLHNWDKPRTDFNKLDERLEEKKIMKKYMVGGSLIRIINAPDMFEFTINLLKKDPDYLLIKEPKRVTTGV